MAARLLASLYTRIVVGTIVGGAVLTGLVLVTVDRLRAAETEASHARAAQVIAAVVAERVETALGAGDLPTVQRTARRAVERGTLVAVAVFNRDHQVVASEPAGVLQGSILAEWPADTGEQANVNVRAVPVLAGFQVLRGREEDIGGLWTAVDRRPLQSGVASFRRQALLIALGALVACTAAALVAAHLIVRPLAELTGTVSALTRGELQARHLVEGPREVQGLARQLNRLAELFESARATQIRLAADLDKQVEDRTRQLEQHNRLLRQIGHQDLLTGLPNRLGLQEEMAKYISLCRRSGQPLAVIMLDLDGFKAYNDTLGHSAGDKALCTAAAALKGRARASDVVARWGGDEFCILIPSTPADRALMAAEGFIAAVTEATRDLPRPATGSALGASAGVACFPEDGEEQDELVNRADAALYRAKAAGKGRVFRASPTQAEARV